MLQTTKLTQVNTPYHKRRCFRLLRRADVTLENRQLHQQRQGPRETPPWAGDGTPHGQDAYFIAKVMPRQPSQVAVATLHARQQQMRVPVAPRLR